MRTEPEEALARNGRGGVQGCQIHSNKIKHLVKVELGRIDLL